MPPTAPSDPSSLGHAPTYGPADDQVGFPLGGIGTGTVALGARGEFRDWQIYNRPSEGLEFPFAFVALRCSTDEGPVHRVVEAEPEPPHHAFRGLPPTRAAGLPRFDDATFTGTYPTAHVEFADEAVPVAVTLDAYTPCVPLDPDDSGLPVAVLEYGLHNPTDERREVSLVGSFPNPVGGLPAGEPKVTGEGLGGNHNAFREGEIAGVEYTSERYGGDDLQAGSAALAVRDREGVFANPGWGVSDHLGRQGFRGFWNEFTADGVVEGDDAGPTEASWTDVGSVGRRVELAPGDRERVTFLLAWHFPNRPAGWDQSGNACDGAACGCEGETAQNHYATRFDDAWAVAAYADRGLDRLRGDTYAFRDALHDSTLPGPVVDAAAASLSVLRSPTCFRLADGTFVGYEGCRPDHGCCPGTCTHVWNYAHTAAHVFPSLEREMRRVDFEHGTAPNGKMAFRTPLPLVEDPSAGDLADRGDAADGQFGTVLRAYREWRHSGDDAFLQRLWPTVEAAVEYATESWDPDGDGVMEGVQHNTYDIEFRGPNAMCTSWYLGGLAAAAEMADALGEDAAAGRFRDRLASGTAELDRRCFNGEYYEQDIEDPDEHRSQFGAGCLSDQLLGQWYADLLGLGDLLPAEHVGSALDSVYEHNFRPGVDGDGHCGRTYATTDEPALALCTWPRGGEPDYPFHFAGEAWTGVEYQVASHLIERGRVDAGLDLVSAVRGRHDGLARNPYNEAECGNYYARSMAAWAVYQSYAGLRVDLPNRDTNPAVDSDTGVGVDPVTDGSFRCFWATDEAWGVAERDEDGTSYDVLGER
jgi:uncharacterized protein (DUF608 family)